MKRLIFLALVLVGLTFCTPALASYECPGAPCIWEDISGGGKRLLENDGTLIREWTPAEWAADGAAIEGAAVEIGNINTTPGLEGGDVNKDLGEEVGKSGYIDGQEVILKARVEGTSLNLDVGEGLDTLGKSAGTLPEDLGASALGEIALAAGTFTLGVFIGTELGQLFHFPGFDNKPAEEHVESLEGHPCQLVEHPHPWTGSVGTSSFSLPSGFYVYCDFQEVAVYTESDVCESEKLNLAGECTGSVEFDFPFPGAEDVPFRTKSEEFCHGEHGCFHQEEGFFEYYPSECFADTEVLDVPCPPEGIPAPAETLISPGQEKINEEKTGHSRPSVALPPAPHFPVVTEKAKKKALEITPVRKYFEEKGHKHQEEAEEEAEKGLILPAPETNETAVEYNKRIEGDGFTNTSVSTRPEIDTNPTVGPDDVAGVSPAPNGVYAPDTRIKIEANPEDAPIPGAEPGDTVGPPSEPGFHLPNFGILCKGFPFGVPCWLAETIAGWSASAEAPIWGVNEIEVEHTKIPPIKFDLAKLEPIMEYVRPAILIFATIGLVLLFFSFAKGGGPPSGGNADTGGGQSYSEEQGEFISGG